MGHAVLPGNRCDLPPWMIASPHFIRNPRPIGIQGVRRAHRSLFALGDEELLSLYRATGPQAGKYR